MKELNIFFFGFGQVAKEFTKKLLSEKYKLNISITTRQASGEIEFLGQKVSNFEFNNEKIDKNIQCFCVGSSTEKLAKYSGFQNIFCAEGNVNNLKEVILQNFDVKKGSLLYVSGELITTNLHKQLIDEDYQVERIVNYNVEHITELDLKFIDQLKKNMPNIIYVYSQNSAKSLLKIIKKYELIDYWMNTNLMCLGEKTSSVLNEIKWKKIFLFNPGEEEFLLYKI